jgi:hypothetical protein
MSAKRKPIKKAAAKKATRKPAKKASAKRKAAPTHQHPPKKKPKGDQA